MRRRTKINIIMVILTVLVFSQIAVIALIHIAFTRDNDEDGGGFEELSHGPYTRTLNRYYSTERELELIRISEDLPSNVENVSDFDNVKLYSTASSESIEYYYDLVEKIEQNHVYTGFDVKRAEMVYDARVEYVAVNNNTVTMVHLDLYYHHYVNGLNAIWYNIGRIVTFALNGTVDSVVDGVNYSLDVA